jgi:GT2 family glycosyltransferase
MIEPRLSVVIPSHNRRSVLEMVLHGLARQTFPPDSFETIVVLDGPTDDSPEMLAAWQKHARLANLRWHTQPQSGQATARNAGVELARAPIVVFLDDDIVPEPTLLAEHEHWYRAGAHVSVLGDCHIVREYRRSLYQLGVWAWWEDLYYQRARAGHQPSYRDFCAGNVSIRREDFLKIGGFDTGFRGYGGEDYDLGYRLLKTGVHLVADPQAQALHYHRTTVDGVLRSTRQEAHGDVLLGRKHPELRGGLRLAMLPVGRYRQLAKLALKYPVQGDRMMRVLRRSLPIYELALMQRRWIKLFGYIRGYAYWRGIQDALGSYRGWREYVHMIERPTQILELRHGLPDPLPSLWTEGPSVLNLTWDGAPFACMDLPAPLGEPLRPYLARQIVQQFSGQLALLLASDSPRRHFLPALDSAAMRYDTLVLSPESEIQEVDRG